jgi:hypothetical protein
LKGLLALCITGAVIFFYLLVFPALAAIVLAANANGAMITDAGITGINMLVQYLALNLLLIMALATAGSVSREIMGG